MRARRLLTGALAGAIAVLLAAGSVSAQDIQRFQGGPPGPQGPGDGGGPQRLPPRDGRGPAPAVGTSVIRGRVFAADTKRPLRRARVTVNSPGLGGEGRMTSTDADGRYEIKDLPPGRYTVAVNRSGYLRLTYGQRRPFEQGKPLQVADKDIVDGVDFLLPRMSLITGRIVDETGEPISGVRVFAMRTAYFEGRRRLVPVAGGPIAMTDDTGQYRILGLTPGSYFVMSDVRETWTVNVNGVEQTLGYAPTYFPGTASVSDARRITVGVGEEASNNDFPLVPGRAASVSGFATDSQGRPLAGRQVSVMQEFRGPGFGMFMTSGSGATVAPDGTFRIRNLPPGEYKLTARTAVEGADGATQETASVPIVIDGIDLENVTLATSSGWTLAGQVTAEDGTAPMRSSAGFQVAARPVNGDQTLPGGPRPGAEGGRVRDDWTFTVSGILGAARIRATVPDGWIVKAILQDGRDVTDAAFEGRTGEVVPGLQIVVSDRLNTLSGQLTDDKGVPIADGTVLVFSADSSKWTDDSRYVQAARPDQDGKYQIRGLPPGEYLAAALDYVEEGMWNDPEYLESIRGLGQRFTLGEADSHALMLKMSAPQ
jgi:protocatechuate 3,4-dioxygenase beta subunit